MTIERILNSLENQVKSEIKRIGPVRAAQMTGLRKQNVSGYITCEIK